MSGYLDDKMDELLEQSKDMPEIDRIEWLVPRMQVVYADYRAMLKREENAAWEQKLAAQPRRRRRVANGPPQ